LSSATVYLFSPTIAGQWVWHWFFSILVRKVGQTMTGKVQFSSSLALFLATIGMAIGAGNIWRFPRLIGEFGGAFLIPWLLFLFLWSLPIAIFELGLGKSSGKGVIATFKEKIGRRFVWLGIFISACTAAIMFYYSVVTGWALWFAGKAIIGGLPTSDLSIHWQEFTAGFEPLAGMVLTVIAVFFVLRQSLQGGLERINKIFIPSLFVLLFGLAIYANLLPGAEHGRSHLFQVDWQKLAQVRIWLEGLSQSAWSTGAGWGLFLTYGAYMRAEDGVVRNAIFAALGNNFASLVAALAIVPAIYALSGGAADEILARGNQGLAFVAIPALLNQLPGGMFSIFFFFLALFLAAFSSLLAMAEMSVRNIVDIGLSRTRAVAILLIAMLLLGLPAALSLDFFDNQDWVWGLGLLVSGLFYYLAGIAWRRQHSFAGIAAGLNRINQGGIQLNSLYDFIWRWLLPLEFMAMLIWWLGIHFWSDPASLFALFDKYSVGTVIWQWFLLLLVARLGQFFYLRKEN
jgi:NSS family neurotransmitter:Na+ symporter